MRYIGGKNRIAEDISKIILRDDPGIIIEPFCGALNVSLELIRQKPDVKVVCSDIHAALIDMWLAVQSGWIPPSNLSKEEYMELSKAEDSPLRTFAGYGCSFSGKWFGGYASDNTGRNYCANAQKSILKNTSSISKITFNHGDYASQLIPFESVVYCDPPYASTTKPGQRNSFDHEKFWTWAYNLPVDCYISEYQAPWMFEPVWEKEVKTDMQTLDGKSLRVEKLFLNRTY